MWRVDSDFRCPGFNQRVLRAIKSSNAKLVVLVGSFVNNVTIGKFRDINAGYVIDSCRSMQEFEINLQQTVEHTHAPGAKVVVFTEPPRLNANSVNEYLRKQSLGLTTEKIYADKKTILSAFNVYTT